MQGLTDGHRWPRDNAGLTDGHRWPPDDAGAYRWPHSGYRPSPAEGISQIHLKSAL